MYPVQALKAAQPDPARLLKPVSPDSAGGKDLRYSGIYDEIRSARQEDDASISRGVWVAPLKRADWQRVQAICVSSLEKRSKDVQIGAWLVEAWVHLYGYRGLLEGLSLLADLCNGFWDDLYPKIDGDDPDYRLAPFVWLNEKLPVDIKMVALTRPDSDDIKSYSWSDWEVARRAQDSDNPAPGNSQGTSQAAFQQSVMLTPADFYSGLYADVSGCVGACERLQSELESRCGSQSPTLGNISRTVTQIRDYLGGVLDQRHISRGDPAPEPSQDAGPSSLQEAGAGAAASQSATGPIRSRAEAYRRLAEAADYLATTEPHSPSPYLIRRAIRWGSLPLTELLPELVRNNDELSEIYRLLQMSEL